MSTLLSPQKALGALLAAVIAFIGSAPLIAHMLPAVAFWFFVLDWFSGVTSAALQRDASGKRMISSSEMRGKTRLKLLCYAQIIGLGVGIGALAQSWYWYAAAWGAVMASEAWSIVENINKSATAPELAPLRAFADRALVIVQVIAKAGDGTGTPAPQGDSTIVKTTVTTTVPVPGEPVAQETAPSGGAEPIEGNTPAA